MIAWGALYNIIASGDSVSEVIINNHNDGILHGLRVDGILCEDISKFVIKVNNFDNTTDLTQIQLNNVSVKDQGSVVLVSKNLANISCLEIFLDGKRIPTTGSEEQTIVGPDVRNWHNIGNEGYHVLSSTNHTATVIESISCIDKSLIHLPLSNSKNGYDKVFCIGNIVVENDSSVIFSYENMNNVVDRSQIQLNNITTKNGGTITILSKNLPDHCIDNVQIFIDGKPIPTTGSESQVVAGANADHLLVDVYKKDAYKNDVYSKITVKAMTEKGFRSSMLKTWTNLRDMTHNETRFPLPKSWEHIKYEDCEYIRYARPKDWPHLGDQFRKDIKPPMFKTWVTHTKDFNNFRK